MDKNTIKMTGIGDDIFVITIKPLLFMFNGEYQVAVSMYGKEWIIVGNYSSLEKSLNLHEEYVKCIDSNENKVYKMLY